MDMLEKISRSFGTWYEGLFGGNDDVRPKDILRRVLAALEDHRKEGFDNKTYVPNQYILEINVNDAEEKEYLLSFLDRHELEAAIRRYCQQNRYQIRGALEFVIKEVDPATVEEGKRQEKVRVRCRYTTRNSATEPLNPAAEGIPLAPALPAAFSGFDEARTVANMAEVLGNFENATIPGKASATLAVHPIGRPPFQYAIYQPGVTIGRSSRAGNDLILEGDGLISKRHARLERDVDGNYTLYDLGSTNGTKVNGTRIDNRTLSHGDEIMVGITRLIFERNSPEESLHAEPAPAIVLAEPRTHGIFGGAAASLMEGGGTSSPPIRRLRTQVAKLLIVNAQEEVVEDYPLASETLIGRGVTNDVVLPERSVATRHACILHDGDGFTIEAFADANTMLNGIPLEPRQPIRLTDGDTIEMGAVRARFECKAKE